MLAPYLPFYTETAPRRNSPQSPQTQGKKMRCFFLKPSQGSIPLYIKKQKAPCWVSLFFGADEGNRTPVISLGSFYSTIELHLQINACIKT